MSDYLKTLRRVPDDVILATASREFDMGDATTCICGWVLRESLARMTNKRADDVDQYDYLPSEYGTVPRCVSRFGGGEEEWTNIFDGVGDARFPAIELAFVDRVLEAVEATS